MGAGRSVVAVIATLLLISACTDDGRAPSEAAPSVSPSPSGKLTFGFLGEASTLDPYAAEASALTYALVRPVLPSLFRSLPDGSVEPYLAAAVERDGDGVLVTLRDASWSDGRPITAGDVVASWARASAPSGFDRIRHAEAIDQKTVRFTGRFRNWERVLATGTFVLPDGTFRPRVSGGPMKIRRHRPGLRLDYEHNDAFFGEGARLDALTAFFYEDLSVMLDDLAAGDVDSAAPPLTVNLGERLTAAGIEHDSVLGSEQIGLFALSVSRKVLERFPAALDLGASFETFIEGNGERLSVAGGSDPPNATVASPRGDELLGLLARSAHFQARDAGVILELAEIESRLLYGDDSAALDGLDVAWGRRFDVAGRFADHPFLPLFAVKTYVAWRPGIEGPAVNPSLEGPLWNVEEWFVSGEG